MPHKNQTKFDAAQGSKPSGWKPSSPKPNSATSCDDDDDDDDDDGDGDVTSRLTALACGST